MSHKGHAERRHKPTRLDLLFVVMAALPACLGAISPQARADETKVTAKDGDGAFGRAAAPTSAEIQLPPGLQGPAGEGRLRLADVSGDSADSPSVPAQYEPASPSGSPAGGVLWWLMPPGRKGLRVFRLVADKDAAPPAMTASWDDRKKQAGVLEDKQPVLRYAQGATEPPAGISREFARGDYVSELFGPYGEALTEDYPKDHPHHRALNWSWATVRWKGQTRDLFAVRGIWSRPVKMNRCAGGSVLAVIDAENEWKWDDKDAVVHERVVIQVFRQAEGGRCIDVVLRLTPLVEELEFAGRLGAGYSGFNLRMAPGRGQQMLFHTDPPQASRRRSWADYSADFTGGKGRSGVAILQNATNPLYPSEWVKYPDLNFFQPGFPGPKLAAMPKGKTISLRYRLWIHRGTADEKTLSDQWAAYNASWLQAADK